MAYFGIIPMYAVTAGGRFSVSYVWAVDEAQSVWGGCAECDCTRRRGKAQEGGRTIQNLEESLSESLARDYDLTTASQRRRQLRDYIRHLSPYFCLLLRLLSHSALFGTLMSSLSVLFMMNGPEIVQKYSINDFYLQHYV